MMSEGFAKISIVALAAACAVGGVPAYAATLVDTGAKENLWTHYRVIQKIFGQISLTAASRIETVQGFMDSPQGGGVRVTLRSDLGGRPGDILQSPGATAYSTIFGTRNKATQAEWQGATGLGWQVAAGTYWVSFENDDTTPFALTPGMKVDVAVNPLAKYASSARGDSRIWNDSGNFGFRVLGTVSPVPEPATWAMMIVGFGVVGAMMRRRKASFATA